MNLDLISEKGMGFCFREDTVDSDTSLWKWEDLIRFQLNIADRWLTRGNETQDIFSKFFSYFTGFNALYFLWRKIDGIEKGEAKQIENLLRKFDTKEAQQIFGMISTEVNYFSERLPIQRMDTRTAKNPFIGEDNEGRKWQKALKETSSALDRLVAIGEILYLVRSNLFHGSKAESGDDEEIIKSSILPLKVLLTKAISMTRAKCR